MHDLIRLPATEVLRRVRRGHVASLELIEAAAARIAAVNPQVDAPQSERHGLGRRAVWTPAAPGVGIRSTNDLAVGR